MTNQKSGSSARAGRAKKNAGSTQKVDEIDFSDIPEASESQLEGMKRVGRPPMGATAKQLIAIRLDPALLAALQDVARLEGKKYQTLIHEVLTQYVRGSTFMKEMLEESLKDAG